MHMLLPIFTTIHKDVVFPGVGVEIAVDRDAVIILQQLRNQHLDVVDRRKGFFDSVFILSVQIRSR